MLPSKYYDNIDYDIISNGIYVKTLPTIEKLISYIQTRDNEIVIWGAGYYGKKYRKAFEMNGIIPKLFIDQNLQSGKIKADIPIMTFEQFMKTENDKTMLLLVGNRWKEMLKTINDSKFKHHEIFYINNSVIDKYMQENCVE